jgi:hypothetical protein
VPENVPTDVLCVLARSAAGRMNFRSMASSQSWRPFMRLLAKIRYHFVIKRH